MSLRLWPNNYENKDYISKEEKRLLRNALKNFKDGHFAVGIDPMGLNNENCKMGLFISPYEGLVTFSVLQGDFIEKNEIAYSTLISMYEDRIYKRLLDSMHLIARNRDNKTLRFPYKHIIVFPAADGLKQFSLKDDSLNSRIYRGFFRPINSEGKERFITDLKIFSDIRKSYDNGFKKIDDLECRCIFERLAPEYSVIVDEKESEVVPITNSITEKDMLITGEEAEYKTFFLDEYQVTIVNDMGRGHRVLLANPGAGKSVLLLSRAFKYSTMYKDSNVLLTCYNNNLADSYNFKYNCAGYIKKNLYIMTFHKLVKQIYEECLGIPIRNIEDEDILNCIEKIKRGFVKLKFKAIFIDEVQIFDPMYIELCYLLLDKEDDDSFLMTGDLNQNIRKSSKRGDAPWKRMKDIHLDFTGRVKYMEKNYRNSRDISIYIKNMLELMNKRFSMLKMVDLMEYEYNTFKLGDKETIALKIIREVPRIEIKRTVLNAIQEITGKYNIAYNDVAILFPYKQYKTLKYYFLDWIKDGLDSKDIPYSVIIRSDESHTQFHNTSGVILSTIESSLGLDFKAVIVAGLQPYDYICDDSGEKPVHIPVKSWKAIQGMSPQNKEKVQNQMRTIYTACSRARDILYVISDLKPKTPMDEIIKE